MKVDEVNEGVSSDIAPFCLLFNRKVLQFMVLKHSATRKVEVQTIISFKLDSTGECYFKTLGNFGLNEFIYPRKSQGKEKRISLGHGRYFRHHESIKT